LPVFVVGRDSHPFGGGHDEIGSEGVRTPLCRVLPSSR